MFRRIQFFGISPVPGEPSGWQGKKDEYAGGKVSWKFQSEYQDPGDPAGKTQEGGCQKNTVSFLSESGKDQSRPQIQCGNDPEKIKAVEENVAKAINGYAKAINNAGFDYLNKKI